MAEIDISKLKEHFDALWTQTEVEYAFNVSIMTIWKWRHNRGFPASVRFATRASRYDPEAVTAWAGNNGYRIRQPRRPRKRKAA